MIGTKVAHYEITSRLGIGGMGEVYQAADTKLGRNVAIKILPAVFAKDADRLARFRREAQVLASLNHPNIAQIYGVEDAGDTQCIVMELIEGQTLQARIKRGPIPSVEALEIARHIAEALETAHEKGVIHRDMKPGNVMLTNDGKVKVLDFGLAKAWEGASGQESSNSPTRMSMIATNAGVILGTAGYMSPEQARGHAADQRSDVFSFGCVLYEMLTGRQAFQGETVTDIIAAVVAREPDYSALPSNLHGKLKDLLVRCLAKNRKDRWHAIADLRIELEAIIADPHERKVTAAREPFWKRSTSVAVAVVLTAAITAAITWNLRPQRESKPIARYSFTLPGDQNFTRAGRQVVAMSHNGANLVYAANGQLYLKSVGEVEAKPMPGSKQDVSSPIFSPDDQWIAFTAVTERKLKKIPLAGGASVTLADMENPFGISWSADDQIFVGQNTGIVRVRGGGGKPEIVIAAKSGETLDGPQLLPGGQYLLFSILPASAGPSWDGAQIVVQNLKSGERKVVIDAGSDGRYISTGRLTYAVGATVFAVPFDLKKLQATGGPVPILEDVRRASQDTTAAAFFGLSDNGTLAFVPGDLSSKLLRLALVSRDGSKKALPPPPNGYDIPRISPDGKHIAVGIQESKDFNIWIYDVDGDTSIRRLTFGGRNQSPEWTPDSKRVVFRSDRDGEGLYWQFADGSGTAERLSTAEKGQFHAPVSWAPDKKQIIFYLNRKSNSGEFWTLSPGDGKPTPFVASTSNMHRLSFSPDGRWMAYGSNEEARYEVYVQPFPPTGAKYKITKTGGDSPLWTADGRQLIFESSRHLVYVDVQTQSGFVFSEPKSLPIDVVNTQGRPYDITPDGKQFLVMQRPPDDKTEKPVLQINMVLNWFTELNQRVPIP